MNKKSKGGPFNLVFLSDLVRWGKSVSLSQEIQTWATVLEGDVFNHYIPFSIYLLKSYDIIMIELIPRALAMTKKIKRKYPNKKLIGVLEGSLHTLGNDLQLKTSIEFIEAYRTVDALGVLIKDSIPYFQSITNKPVFWLGVPFPVEWSRAHIIPPEKKEPIAEMLHTFCSGMGGLTNFFTLKEIQKLHPEAKGRGYSNKRKLDQALADRFGLNLEILPPLAWQKYFIRHSQAYLALHLDHRWTWNRYSLDCAAAGIPCISTPHSTTHKMLFPNLCVDPFDTKQAVVLAIRLLENPGFYKDCREYALEKIRFFDFENSAKRFTSFLSGQNIR